MRYLLNILSFGVLLFFLCIEIKCNETGPCITSDNIKDYPDAYPRNGGGRGRPCVFPFKVRGKTYHSCTFDSAHRTNYKAWCSTNTTDDGFHRKKGSNWGICIDRKTCPIPPRSCGIPSKSRRASSDQQNNVDIEQQPWMVSLGEKLPGGKNGLLWRHECGGSLITDRHVLTAAHCLFPVAGDKERRKRYYMLLGTSDFTNTSRYVDKEGAFQYRKVKHIRTHPLYTPPKPYWDVGIVIAERNIEFNDYIRPVCLPFRPNEDPDQLADQHVTLAGFGQFIDPNTGRVTDPRPFLKLATLQANSQYLCNKIFSPRNLKKAGIASFKRRQQIPQGIRRGVICAGNDFDITQTSCEGDSGGPVVRQISGGARAETYYEQAFIVSTGLSCKDLPAQIFVRVADRNVLRWIQDVTDTQPLLMVYGGYGKADSAEKNKLLDSVELISSNKHFLCQKHVSSIYSDPNDDFENRLGLTAEETETQVLGSVGAYTQDAALFCGGENRSGRQKHCHEYLPTTNTWERVKDMSKERFLATAALNKGRMWVIGGVKPGDVKAATCEKVRSASSTEEYTYKRSNRDRNRNLSKWQTGKPIPAYLRDSGIVGHCTVQINDTYIFMAGGYAPEYHVIDPSIVVKPDCNEETPTPELDPSFTPRLPTITEFLEKVGVYDAALRGKRQAEDDCYKCTTAWAASIKSEGKPLAKAWIYDGYYWVELPDMPDARDRPACSLLEKSDADKKLKRQIIVAGGCIGACKETEATKTTLIFDIEDWEKQGTKYKWQKVADLPKPLSNAKMEVLEGLPTLIGGIDTNTKEPNGELYQYYFVENEWRNHSRLRMEVPRISPTVIDVPKDLFNYCFANLNPPAEVPKEDFFEKDKNKCYEDKDIYDIIENGGTPRSGLEDNSSLVRSTRDKRQARRNKKKGKGNKKGGKKRRKKKKCECQKPKKKICPPRCQYPKDEFLETQDYSDYNYVDYESDTNSLNLRSDLEDTPLIQDAEYNICLEGDKSCCKEICKNPNKQKTKGSEVPEDGNSEEDIELIKLRTVGDLCFEGEECCSPPKKLCQNRKAPEATTASPSYEYAYEDYENPAPIQLRTDTTPCYEGEECCEPEKKICQNPKTPTTTTPSPAYEYAYEDYENPAPIELRADSGPCYEGEECCNPVRPICQDPKATPETTTPAYEYAYEDYENPAPIQLRADDGPCYEGDDCCNPKRKICKYLKPLNDTIDYDYNENDAVNLFVRNDNDESCYEGDDCCNNDILSIQNEDDINLIKLRSDSYNDYNCEEIGISNIASVGDVSQGLLDILAPNEEDSNIVQLGVRTVTQDCICKLPKKRCNDFELRTADDEDEEYDEEYGEETTEAPVNLAEGNEYNANYVDFPL